jgi:hypothetical protein
MNLARVIINIVAVFVICHIPRYFATENIVEEDNLRK